MSLAARISAGFLLLVAVMAATSWHQLAVIDRLHAEGRELTRIDLEATSLSLGLQERVARLRRLGHKFLVLRDAAYAAELGRLRVEAAAQVDRLRALDLGAAERRRLERLESAWDGYAAGAEARQRRVFERRSSPVEPLRGELDQQLDAVAGELEGLLQVCRQAMEARVTAGGERVARARRIAWGATIAGLVAAVSISVGLTRSLVRPLRHLAGATRELADGRLDHRVTVAGGSELEALAEDFNSMARRLGELDQLKKDFVANVSHDLKAPLASIQEANELLLEEIPGPLTDRQRRLLELNRDSGGRLTRMIGDLLDLARLETGTVVYDLRRQDLTALVDAAADALAALAADKGLKLERDFPATAVAVDCDGAAIVKVVQNLLANAIKFTPAGGEIRLRVRDLDDGAPAVVLEVEDSGPGIPEPHKRRIFERFHRLDGGDGPAGSGLGLAIAREIVAGHGGELWVEDAAGGGSVFKVRLRRPPAASAPAVKASTAALVLIAASLPMLGGCRGPEPPPIVRPTALEIGDSHFERGDLAAASAAYETWLAGSPPIEAVDRVLFRLALIRTLPGSPAHDPRRGRRLFAELVERYPRSPFRPAAEYLLALQLEVERLRQQLEEIKRIDLGGG